LTSPFVRAVKVPPAAVLHLKSPAGFVVRAGAPGDVLVAVQNEPDERRCNVHGALALTVSVGPVVELNPASKSAGEGAVSAELPALICRRTTLPAVIVTLPG
jgi:hypothetical protein